MGIHLSPPLHLRVTGMCNVNTGRCVLEPKCVNLMRCFMVVLEGVVMGTFGSYVQSHELPTCTKNSVLTFQRKFVRR